MQAQQIDDRQLGNLNGGLGEEESSGSTDMSSGSGSGGSAEVPDGGATGGEIVAPDN